jgi:hypothetical protein
MKRLLFGYFVILSLLRLSYAEPLCKNDVDCVVKYELNNRDIRYLTYGCDNYKDQSFGHSCMKLYDILLDKIKKDIVYLCEVKGNSSACINKNIYNFDLKFRDKTSVGKEALEILKQSERKCENEVDLMECVTAFHVHKFLGNSEKAKYYFNKFERLLWEFYKDY